MTPAERAVIDAARALEPVLQRVVSGITPDDFGNYIAADDDLRELDEAAPAFLAAVRALPRPLSEQLAELRVGAVVEAGEKHWLVKANDPELMELWLRSLHETINGQPYNWTAEYNEIEAVVSNPEAARG